MKIKFLNAENLIDGIELLADDLGFKISEEADLTVTVKEID